MKTYRICAAAFLLVSISGVTLAKTPRDHFVGLRDLYQRYVDAGYSALNFSELNGQVFVSGVALKFTESISGGVMLIAGDKSSSDELARISAADDDGDRRLKSLKIGKPFKAICDLGFTSGSEWMSLQNCIVK
ncbi:hypothetical protein [Burkholderia stagnalis]|uniref:hypothetical protein n=1 Tax=Burkholderia stagnalis TaxID=1503054 RepID=UPI000F7FE423|nr:hypothetical protein [Burkholderia stagnalis]